MIYFKISGKPESVQLWMRERRHLALQLPQCTSILHRIPPLVSRVKICPFDKAIKLACLLVMAKLCRLAIHVYLSVPLYGDVARGNKLLGHQKFTSIRVSGSIESDLWSR